MLCITAFRRRSGKKDLIKILKRRSEIIRKTKLTKAYELLSQPCQERE